MNKLTDFNDLRDPDLILECIAQAQPMPAPEESLAAKTTAPVTPLPDVFLAESAEDIPASDACATMIHRLAMLGQVEYDQVRKQEANRCAAWQPECAQERRLHT